MFALAGSLAPASAADPDVLAKLTVRQGWETPVYASRNSHDVGEQFSSAAVGDIDGNAVPDIVAGFPDGTVQAWRTDNGARWLSVQVGDGAVQASPTLVDLDRDGTLDVLAASTGGQVLGFRADRSVLFRQATTVDPKAIIGVFGTPVAADLDQDGSLEIIVTGWDRYLHVWSLAGKERPGFPTFVHDTIWSSPSVGDLDADGLLEIVFGFDCEGVPGQWCHPIRGGYVGAVGQDGRWVPGWPRFVPGQVIWSSPALADLDGDRRLDVIVGTGNMDMTGGQEVLALRGDGTNLPGWPVAVGGKTTSSPAVGDVDGDGRAEVAIASEDGKVYVIGRDGRVRWARCISNDVSNCANKPLHASPTIGDVTGDGSQEVVVGGEQWLNVFNGDGALVARGETFAQTNPLTSAPSLISLAGRGAIVSVSGTPDLTRSGGDRGRGRVFVWSTGRALGATDWPQFKRTSQRTGAVEVARTAPAPVNGPAIMAHWTLLGGTRSALGAVAGEEYLVPGGVAQNFADGKIFWSAATGARGVWGDILGRYEALGGPGGPLRLPTSDELGTRERGAYNAMQGGRLMWQPGIGAWGVLGGMNEVYGRLRAEWGPLGFPVSDEGASSVAGTVVQRFRGGATYWSAARGTRAVWGDIHKRWLAYGGERGPLGVPLTSEVPTGAGGVTAQFAAGRAYWHPSAGAHVVYGQILSTYLAAGGPTGRLGTPTSSEHDVPGGRANHFAGGVIRWDTASGGVTLTLR